MTEAQTLDKKHGRIEHRQLTASSRLPLSISWPGAQQICVISRTRKIRGQATTEVVYAITSLAPTRANAHDLLRFSRQHWGIENRLHYVRDVTFGEDASQVHVGSLPQSLAALRNTALSLLRSTGASNIAAQIRDFSCRTSEALSLLLSPPPPITNEN